MFIDKAKEVATLLEKKGEHYHAPESFFVQLAHVWSGMLGIDISPSQCCAMIVAFKSCRVINNPKHEDTADDLVGYALIMTELVKLKKDNKGKYKYQKNK